MKKTLRITAAVLALMAASWVQNPLAVQATGKQRWPAEEVQKLYLAACSAVEREFGATLLVPPQVTLVLGADKNDAVFNRREIRLTKWNPYLFAEGVVIFAFEEFMDREKLVIARRAVNWADSTVEINAVSK